MILDQLYSVVLVFLITGLVFFEYQRSRELISPWILFLLLSVIDIYMPIAIVPNSFTSNNPWYVPTGIITSIFPSLVFFSVGIFLFGLGYFWVINRGKKKNKDSSTATPHIQFNIRRVRILFAISTLWYLLLLMYQWQQAGSIQEWFSGNLLQRFVGRHQEYSSFSEQLFIIGGMQMWNVILVCIGIFFYLREKGNKFLRGFLLPIFGILVASTTFFRGSQLVFIGSLIIIESMRSKKKRFSKPSRNQVILLAVLAIGLFVGYGTWRNTLIGRERGFEQTTFVDGLSFEVKRAVQGAGLRGLSSIISFYPRGKDFFYGKTIVDMMLMPVPRAIWKAKPSWYGIDDITRGMGWPSSTQSAVTIPGELYANFGYFGIFFMVVYGIIFGTFYKNRHHPKFSFVYATWITGAVLTTFWMGFTGFMNNLKSLPIMWLVLQFCVSLNRTNPVVSDNRLRVHWKKNQNPAKYVFSKKP